MLKLGNEWVVIRRFDVAAITRCKPVGDFCAYSTAVSTLSKYATALSASVHSTHGLLVPAETARRHGSLLRR
jgi:hypothetical protein